MITTFPVLWDLGQLALNIFQFDAECHKETHGFLSLLMMCHWHLVEYWHGRAGAADSTQQTFDSSRLSLFAWWRAPPARGIAKDWFIVPNAWAPINSRSPHIAYHLSNARMGIFLSHPMIFSAGMLLPSHAWLPIPVPNSQPLNSFELNWRRHFIPKWVSVSHCNQGM